MHYHPKLKNLNGIEALIGALGSKKLSDENVSTAVADLLRTGEFHDVFDSVNSENT